ncbi:MAG: TetR family transcriptional regulator [Bacteroidales bacterium]|jgi:AcrR family transcriptional regulator|nr:TetR family transcriptional regulator [Bacteroidales bacterium]
MNDTISERQKEIIKTSLELIAEKGIQGLTIKNLSKKIGIVESAIYRHYESKTHILAAILDSISEQIVPEGAIKVESVIHYLEQKLRARLQTFTATPALVSVIFAEDLFQNEALLVEKTKAKVQKSIADTTSMISLGQQIGEIRNDIEAEQLAIMIYGSLRMLVKQWRMSDYSFDLIQKGDKQINAMKILLKPL